MAIINALYAARMPCPVAMAIIATPINTLSSRQQIRHPAQRLFNNCRNPKADEQRFSENRFSVRLFLYKYYKHEEDSLNDDCNTYVVTQLCR